MSQFQYCSSNPNYDDVGQLDSCGDTYSSLSGIDSCGLANMSEYQQGMLAMTPSYCNQTSDYAPVRKMYDATQMPAIAALNVHTPITQMNNNMYYNAIQTLDGKVIPPRQGMITPELADFNKQLQEATTIMAANNAKVVDALAKQYSPEVAQAAVEKFANLRVLGKEHYGIIGKPKERFVIQKP